MTTTPTTSPGLSPAVLRKRARSAAFRSAAGDRSMIVLLGLVLLAAGTLVTLLSYGVFGSDRAARPVLDPVVVDALAGQALLSRSVAIAVGVLLTVLGLVWTARSLRPEHRPDVVLDAGTDTAIVVSTAAAADAVGEQAGGLPGVGRAKARVVGTATAPALRVTLWLSDDADVGEVVRLLDEQVLAGARTSFGLDTLPVAVRLELDAEATGPSVV